MALVCRTMQRRTPVGVGTHRHGGHRSQQRLCDACMSTECRNMQWTASLNLQSIERMAMQHPPRRRIIVLYIIVIVVVVRPHIVVWHA